MSQPSPHRKAPEHQKARRCRCCGSALATLEDIAKGMRSAPKLADERYPGGTGELGRAYAARTGALKAELAHFAAKVEGFCDVSCRRRLLGDAS